jgi:hypothetical protein
MVLKDTACAVTQLTFQYDLCCDSTERFCTKLCVTHGIEKYRMCCVLIFTHLTSKHLPHSVQGFH